MRTARGVEEIIAAAFVTGCRARRRAPSPSVARSCDARRAWVAPGGARQVPVEPCGDRRQSGVFQLFFEQPPDSRDVGEIPRLAVAPRQTREDAQDLAV